MNKGARSATRRVVDRRHRSDDGNNPPPVPPARPDNEDCCHKDCDPCIFDLYDDAVDRYRAALEAWEARHQQGPSRKARGTPAR